MSTLYDLSPQSAQFPSTNFPALTRSNDRLVLAFDAGTQETAYWEQVAPQGVSGTWTAIVYYRMASAVSGGVAFDVAVEAVTPGDAIDLDATSSFDSVNTGFDDSVPGTAGYLDQVSITLTNMDGVSAGDRLRFSLARKVSHASDTATGDCLVIGVEIRAGA